MSDTEFITDVTESDFELTVIARSHQIPVVVDFWAEWCGPCRIISPLLEKLAVEGKGAFLLARLDVDDNPVISSQYNVRNLPNIKAFRDGVVVDEFSGALPEPKVREFIRKVAPSEADRALAKAHSLLATRHWSQAEEAFRQAFEDQPKDGSVALGFVKALLAQGKGCEAVDLLENFPGGMEIATAEKLKPLANLLCEVEPTDPPIAESDLDAMFYQAGRLLARGQWEAGMDGLLELLRRAKKYRKGEPRLIVLGIFELLGEDDPRTREYRQELASVLF
jgi:putative thioredoxin